jgi:hypothetical protein
MKHIIKPFKVSAWDFNAHMNMMNYSAVHYRILLKQMVTMCNVGTLVQTCPTALKHLLTNFPLTSLS